MDTQPAPDNGIEKYRRLRADALKIVFGITVGAVMCSYFFNKETQKLKAEKQEIANKNELGHKRLDEKDSLIKVLNNKIKNLEDKKNSAPFLDAALDRKNQALQRIVQELSMDNYDLQERVSRLEEILEFHLQDDQRLQEMIDHLSDVNSRHFDEAFDMMDQIAHQRDSLASFAEMNQELLKELEKARKKANRRKNKGEEVAPTGPHQDIF